MEHCAGVDVSLEQSSVCVVEANRTDLERRAAQAPIPPAELDERLATWPAARDAGEDSDLA